MMNRRPILFPAWAWFGILLAFVSAAYSIKFRVHDEARNQATCLAIDAAWARDVAAEANQPLREILIEARFHGLRAIAVSETTVGDWIDEHRINVVNDGSKVFLQVRRTDYGKVLRRLLHRAKGVVAGASEGDLSWIEITNVPFDLVRDTSLGIDSEVCAEAKKANIEVIARFANRPGTNLGEIGELLLDAKQSGAIGYLPQGDQVLGQRDYIKDVVRQLKEFNLLYFTPEFAKIAGDNKVMAAMPQYAVRVHSIQAAEVDRLSPAEYLERFSKAAKERNIRVLLLRPLSTTSETGLKNLSSTLSKVSHELSKDGVPLGPPRPFPVRNVPIYVFMAIAMATAIVGIAAVFGLGLPDRITVGLSFALMVGFLLALFESTRPFSALSSALVFPIAAYVWICTKPDRSPVLAYFVASIISLAGGLSVAGLLNSVSYTVQVEQFSGVKAAHFLPIVIVGIFLLSQLTDLRKALASSATWGYLALGVVVLVTVAFMLSRTGNDNPAAVSGFELKMRALLDRFLYTRPRTKEFLFGHPAMILGLLSLAWATKNAEHSKAKAYASWGVALLSAGAIGQTSIVNTMCHLHSPVMVSVARIAIGSALGLLFGLLIWAFFRPKRAGAVT